MAYILAVSLILSQFLTKPIFAEFNDQMQEANQLMAKRGDSIEAAKAAVAAYRLTLNDSKTDNQKVKSLEMLTQALYYLGMVLGDKDEKEVVHKEGKQTAAQCLAIQPENKHGLWFYAIHLGRHGELKGIMNSLAMVPEFKDVLEKLKTIDKAYMEYGVFRSLARLYYKLPALAGGSDAKAQKLIEIAYQEAPNNSSNGLIFADLLIKKGNYDLAKKILTKIVNDPASIAANADIKFDRQAEHIEDQKVAQSLLKLAK